MTDKPLFNLFECPPQITLNSPTKLPKSSGFLWNKKMLLQMNCRGYATAQFMQPEPSKYSYAPNLEQKSFMQPEPHYYAHHPGRFFYVKDESSCELFSAPYEPTRAPLDKFEFTIGMSDIQWRIEKLDLAVNLRLSLAKDDTIEIWQIEVINLSNKSKTISIYPYFSVGYMSWMNQSATFSHEHAAIIATSISPYQKLEDYFKQKNYKDKTILLSEFTPTAYCANQSDFEGEGGLVNPDDLQHSSLSNSDSHYQVPAAVLQFQKTLAPNASFKNRLLFGAIKSEKELTTLRQKYFYNHEESFEINSKIRKDVIDFPTTRLGCLKIKSPDKAFDHFVNYWLPRQLFFLGDTNRLTNDPQTRNYLQDNMGMSYIDPQIAKQAFITALSQQLSNGAMPEGVLLHSEASLKYINQIPHTDHSVWLPICLSAYLDETNDYALLNESIGFSDSELTLPLCKHIDLAMDWLNNNRDVRGLSYINQGDWCDPMNMVGYKGKGVSAWLTMATSYAFQTWSKISNAANRPLQKKHYQLLNKQINHSINQHFWDKEWYARGITDDDIPFGVSTDHEGSIYLNPQSWSILCGAADADKIEKLLAQIDHKLNTPFGTMMLAPSYTQMREDIGRLTQKSAGVAENGSVYNHAAIFYAFSLYKTHQKQKAFDVLKKMLPTLEDVETRGQLPNFIPNYYRGAFYQYPEHAGRSSQLFNTGTVSWYYRCLIEGLFGLYGCKGQLIIAPNLPNDWHQVIVERQFMGALFIVDIRQSNETTNITVDLDGLRLNGNIITDIQAGKTYSLIVHSPLNISNPIS